MNRRVARLMLQVLGLGALGGPVITGSVPLGLQLAYLAALGVTVAELAVLLRFGEGPVWRGA